MKLGVLGGTFDPVHMGHVVLAEHAQEQLRLDRVLWLPAGEPWRKKDAVVSSREDRLAMVERAVAGNLGFDVCKLEIERAGPTYTAETLAELGEVYRNSELVFLLGRDALEDLPNWRDPERVIELASLAVASRGADRPSGEGLERLVPGLASRVVWIDMPPLDISATELRQRAREGRSLRYLVPEGVMAYIRDRGLYRDT